MKKWLLILPLLVVSAFGQSNSNFPAYPVPGHDPLCKSADGVRCLTISNGTSTIGSTILFTPTTSGKYCSSLVWVLTGAGTATGSGTIGVTVFANNGISTVNAISNSINYTAIGTPGTTTQNLGCAWVPAGQQIKYSVSDNNGTVTLFPTYILSIDVNWKQ
jgi:hypothetical protein